LLSDEGRLREMGRLGQERVMEKFEWRTLTGEIARLCERVAGPGSARAAGQEPPPVDR